MRRAAHVLLAILAALQIPACTSPNPSDCGVGGEAPHPDIGGQIVFVCYALGNHGSLYLLDVGTGEVRRLTPDTAWNLDPAWSPDGRRIAYQSTRDGRDNVYVMDVESGAVRRLTDGRGFSGYPSWSPDGSWIAFDSSRDGIEAPPNPPGYYRTIYLIRPDGTGLRRLLTFNDVSSGPAWSPRGHQIAFQSVRAGRFDLYVVSDDGSRLEQLTHHEGTVGSATWPRWSADGARIVFSETIPPAGHGEVFWMGLDAARPVQVTDDPRAQWDGWPDWSPDMRWIVFTRAGDSHQLFAIHPDGTGLVQLTNDAGDKDLPRWRP